MKLRINNREVELFFGIRFVRELDKVAGMTANGLNMGMGLNKVLPALSECDPVALSDVLYAASYDTEPRLKQLEIDSFLENPKTDVISLNEKILKAVEESNVIKPMAKKLQLTTNIKK